MANEPRDHHVVPQFFLRNFAVDAARTRITTVAKHGDRAVWAERPIRGLGYERDFYVHMVRGVPVSVETVIARTIETPISQRTRGPRSLRAGATRSMPRIGRSSTP